MLILTVLHVRAIIGASTLSRTVGSGSVVIGREYLAIDIHVKLLILGVSIDPILTVLETQNDLIKGLSVEFLPVGRLQLVLELHYILSSDVYFLGVHNGGWCHLLLLLSHGIGVIDLLFSTLHLLHLLHLLLLSQLLLQVLNVFLALTHYRSKRQLISFKEVRTKRYRI